MNMQQPDPIKFIQESYQQCLCQTGVNPEFINGRGTDTEDTHLCLVLKTTLWKS